MAYAKFDPDKSDFLDTSLKYNGNICAIARHYNISTETIYQYYHRDPIGKEIINIVRTLNTSTDVDLAEHVNRYNLGNYKTDPHLAQKAAEYTLTKKGLSRGWTLDKQIETTEQESKVDIENQLMQSKAINEMYEKMYGKLNLNDIYDVPKTE